MRFSILAQELIFYVGIKILDTIFLSKKFQYCSDFFLLNT